MSNCINCGDRPVASCGSGDYVRRDLCVSCFYTQFQAKTKAEDRLKDEAARQARQVAPQPARAGEPGSSPVWHKGTNVAVREKACDQCGELIHIRRAANGKHYPADHGLVTPHWRSCSKATAS